ncbi:MAG: D-glycero-beta-D-manno-heptose-7-phosphate kinase [Deltaproteobacteria bacterium]|nr:D-glycero-beta-D-manno-heptose-7-phosphate kinase [Deltaproteobacteria bacterium]
MLSSKSDLLEAIEKIQGVPILVVGDLILDRYIWGDVTRISPEAPVPVVLVTNTEDRLGGAGNAVLNLINIGARVSVCGFIGDDEEGEAILNLLSSFGVHKEGVLVDRDRPTCLKTRVLARNQQVVRIDREERVAQGQALKEGFAAVVEANLGNAKAMIVSDYGKGAISASLMGRLHRCKAAGQIGLGICPLVLDPHPVNYGVYEAVCVAKPNKKEAEMAAGMVIEDRESAFKAAGILIKKWNADLMLITLGEGGLVILGTGEDKGIYLETVAQKVFDVSGAGDTVTAVFGAALAAGVDVVVAGELANIAAGLVVSEVGTAPVNMEKLKHKIDQLTDLKA